jgi:hypothetical protein
MSYIGVGSHIFFSVDWYIPNGKTLIVIATSSEQFFLSSSGLEKYFKRKYDTSK